MAERILIIVPAYNEEESIASTLRNLLHTLPAGYDIVVINDGSSDGTLDIVENLKVRCINLPFNMGIGNAVHTGYLLAKREGYFAAVQFDADGQHPEKALKQILYPILNEEADFVIGSRFQGQDGYKSTFIRKIGIRILAFFIFLSTGKGISDPTSGFRAVGKKGITTFAAFYPHDFPEPEAVVIGIQAGLRILEVPVSMNPRKGGRSSINIIKSIYYMIKVSLAILIRSMERSHV